MQQYTGGYLVIKTDLLRTHAETHTAALTNPISQSHLDALNTIQETPWRINTLVLDVVRELWLQGNGAAGLPTSDALPIPQKLPDSEWELMTDEAKSEWKRKKSRAHTMNNEMVSRRSYLLRVLELADTLRDEEEIYFPHSLDFRGRMYPVPQDLNPQGDGLTKALLHFAKGKKIGARGYYWLQVHTANCAGQDKLPLEDRVKWCQQHMLEIMETAKDPLSTVAWWGGDDFDSPFGFVAACQEMQNVADYGFDAITHLPVNVDGSCNGLQHLSALGRDRAGALATNVAANKVRQDIYQRVADRCEQIVAQDVAKGVEEASLWAGKITRSTVKRAVMTTPYGVTARGIRNQLVDDGHTAMAVGENGIGHHKAADYLTETIKMAMDETVAAASTIMGYLQDVAVAFAKRQIPMQWTTPNGCKLQQSYYNAAQNRIDTLYGRMYLSYQDKQLGLDASRQANGAAPNVIHSLDAAHMASTVNFARDVYGISDFAMIHDSYGCHACDMDNLSYAIRYTFLEQYKGDVLGRFHEKQMEVAAPLGIELPVPPTMSDFDISEVLESPFFFA